MTRVVHCKKEPYSVYVGRPGPFGNPFKIGKDGCRTTVIAKFELWIRAQPNLMARVRQELRDSTLGCWCKPLACHGDVLAKIADEDASHQDQGDT